MKKILLLLCILASLPLAAQVDRREVRSGNRDFKKDKFKEAEVDYRKALLRDSTSVAANYNLASALYNEKNYDEAGKVLGTISEAAGQNPDYHYNLGNVALQKKDYAAAVKAFKEALLRNPGDLDAKENYIYAKKMLKNQQDNQNQDQQDQNQDQQQQDQNQNQDQQQQPQNQDQKKDQQQQQQPDQQQMSKQQVQQMLKAIQAEEQKTQDKVNKEKAAALKSRQKEKNW